MNTVLQLTLVIALAIAIVLDIIRIVQYIELKEKNQNTLLDIISKVANLYSYWKDSGASVNFNKFVIDHWNDADKK